MISFTKHAFAAAASTLLIATGINGLGAPSASADTTLGNNAASIANANYGNGPCSTNSAGGIGYYGSCGGDRGHPGGEHRAERPPLHLRRRYGQHAADVEFGPRGGRLARHERERERRHGPLT
jgi:hypothetical protein